MGGDRGRRTPESGDRSPAAHSTSTGAAEPKKGKRGWRGGWGFGGGGEGTRCRRGGHPTVTKDVQAAAVSHPAAAAAERTPEAVVSPGSAAAKRWGRGRGAGVGGPRAGCQHRGEHQPRRGSGGGAGRTAQARVGSLPGSQKKSDKRGRRRRKRGGRGSVQKSPLSSLCVAPPPNGVSRRRGEVASPCRRSRPRADCRGGRRAQSWPLGRRRRQPRRAPKRGGSGHSTGVCAPL